MNLRRIRSAFALKPVGFRKGRIKRRYDDERKSGEVVGKDPAYADG